MKSIFLVIYILCGSTAFAHPTTHDGGYEVMAWNQPELTDLWVVATVHPKIGLAARYMRMEHDQGESRAYFPQANLLLKRWNQKETQANLYLYGGYGFHEHRSQRGDVWAAGVEADAESRRLYILGKVETMRPTHGQNLDLYELRLGAAPYEADFNDVATWLMVQYQHHWQLKTNQSVTPFLRIFYRGVLGEAGVSLAGHAMMNFMVHF